jgi:hypothetical protein
MKTDPTVSKTIDEYIAGFPQDIQEILEKVRATIYGLARQCAAYCTTTSDAECSCAQPS